MAHAVNRLYNSFSGENVNNISVFSPSRITLRRDNGSVGNANDSNSWETVFSPVFNTQMSEIFTLNNTGTGQADGNVVAAPVPEYRATGGMTSFTYRDNSAHSDRSAGANTTDSTPYDPSAANAELVNRFGNLIEGSDPNEPLNKTVYSSTDTFDKGSISNGNIGELLMQISQTVQVTEEHSRRIDDIVKRQEQQETQTLKASDIDRLSEQVIERLRMKLRFDRSRFSS